MNNSDFPALGSGEEKKIQKPSKPKKEEPAKQEEEKIDTTAVPEVKEKSKLKLSTRTFAAKQFVPKQPQKINFYIPHTEPSITEQEYFPTLGGEPAPQKEVETDAIQRHNEFLDRHELFKPYICLYSRDLWYVPDECIDPNGFPMMAMLPELYTYLWVTYNMFFTPEGLWATNAATVMSTLGELWQHAEWRDRVIEKEQKEFEAWEREMKEWEEDNYDELDDGISFEDGGKGKNKNNKGKKNKKKKPKKLPPPMPSRAKESYARFKKDRDETTIVKPKSQFKELKDITFDEEIVEVDETKQPSSLVFIGHVDAGKSTICGNLMFMTGMVDKRTIDKFKQEAKEKNRDSWWLAYVMDISEDEKAKGKTVEVGRATMETKTKRYTIFDAPGHKNYVPDMIMGAAMADTAALVVSARKGEYEAGFEGDGQTREHAQLARSLGVEKLIVIINKMDEDTVKWSEARYNEIVEGITPFLLENCGYKREDLVFVPISGLNGDNILELSSKCTWYNGPTLIEIFDQMALPKRDPTGPLRIPILDKMKDRSVIVFGKVESGTVEIGSKLSLMPNDIKCQVTGIYMDITENKIVKYAKPGENIRIKLRMIDDENQINKGDVLCPFDALAPISELFVAEINILELLPHKQIITPGYKAIMHLHTISEEVIITAVDGVYEHDGTGKEYIKKNPKYVKSGAKIIAKISTRIPVCLEKHEFIEHMGRFTLRDEGKTIALGKVLKYKPAEKKAEGAEDKEKLIQKIEQAQKEKAQAIKEKQAEDTKEEE